MITEMILEQLRFWKQFTLGFKVVYRTSDGVYTWFMESKAVYYKKNNMKYFSEKGKYLGTISL